MSALKHYLRGDEVKEGDEVACIVPGLPYREGIFRGLDYKGSVRVEMWSSICPRHRALFTVIHLQHSVADGTPRSVSRGQAMTADLTWLREFPGRCPACLLDGSRQGHRSPCPPSGPLGVILGERGKREGFAKLDSGDSTDELSLLRREIVALGRRKIDFTPDDLPAELRARTNPNRRGRAFSSLLEDNVIREVDRVKSANPKAHGKTVGVYRLVAA